MDTICKIYLKQTRFLSDIHKNGDVLLLKKDLEFNHFSPCGTSVTLGVGVHIIEFRGKIVFFDH